MKLVIDIPEDIYQYVMNTGTYGHYRFNSAKAIKNGTPLPKGHGRLIDAGVLAVALAQIDWADTIVEADKGE
jgi:hypothetical protein